MSTEKGLTLELLSIKITLETRYQEDKKHYYFYQFMVYAWFR
jgi:hypothetical protein